jgi:hypothetical protein
MDLADACEVIELLANGIDPNSGEVYPESSPYQHPRIVRALYTILLELQQRSLGAENARDAPAKAGKPWSPAEDAQLAEEFDAGEKIAELARRHERTYGAIRTRLVRLGKLDPRQDWFARLSLPSSVKGGPE